MRSASARWRSRDSVRCAYLRRASARLLLLSAAWLLAAAPAFAQSDLEEPLLPEVISEHDVEMRGRYAHQWKQDDGTLVAMFTGGFQLDMGKRRLSANAAVVWITPRRTESDGRRYYELTVYLSENAVVHEIGGTTIEDSVLLVSGLQTYGRVVKYQDAHTTEIGEQSLLYQQADRERLRLHAGPAPEPEPRRPVEVARPALPPKPERPPTVVRFDLPSVEPAETPDGLPVFVAARSPDRRVYFAREGGPDRPTIEILADNAVVFPGERLTGVLLGREVVGEGTEPAAQPVKPTVATPPELSEPPGPGPGLPGLERDVRAVYLEGDVVLSLGTSFVRASRLYYDFEHDRALILDAVFRADIPDRNIPLYVRADEIRQLSAREFAATSARVTTSEFHTPHYHVGAERVYLRDLTERDADGRIVGKITGEYELRNAALKVDNTPILWWPYSKGRFEASETGLRRFRTGYSGDFGVEVETAWHFFNLLGLRQPKGFDTTWKLDYFSERGPGTGIDVDYERSTHFGLFRSYYIYDDGEDNLGPLRRHEQKPVTRHRGRVLWRHRHYLPHDWEATFEVSYLSDANFLEEYEPSEWFESKEQETAIYLKRAGEVDAITLLANWRLLDFLTQTEHLPELTYRRLGDTFLSPFVLYHESRVGGVRYRLDDRHFFKYRRFSNQGSTDLTFRVDARQEVELPLKLGPVNVVPFASFRGTYWDGQPLGDGGLWRGLGVYGLRGSMVFSRVFDQIESELLDIHRIRHIVRPDFAAWWSHGTTRSARLSPFDYGIETIDDFYGVTVGLRQTWQTKRGAKERQRTVDLLTLDLEAGFFGDSYGRNDDSNGWINPLRPENSRTRNYLAGKTIYRLSDTTSLLYDFNFDLDNWASDRQNVSLAVERLPRLAYIFGYRHAGPIDMNLLGGGWNYKLSEKHITTVRCWFDLDRGDMGEIATAYVRKLPRWYVAVSFEYQRVDDDFRVSLSVWPEGIPEWTLGSRRFTGLSTTTGIRP